MTDSTATPPAETGQDVSVHVLRPPLPARAFLSAALGSVLGAILIVVSRAQGWHVLVTALGVILLVAGLILLGAAVITTLRVRVRAELTPTGYSFRTPAGVRHGTWADAVRVTTSGSGRRLTFHLRDESEQIVLSPVGTDDPAMSRMIQDITAHLKTSRS